MPDVGRTKKLNDMLKVELKKIEIDKFAFVCDYCVLKNNHKLCEKYGSKCGEDKAYVILDTND